MRSLTDRFDDKYIPEPNSGCWLWIGATSRCNKNDVRGKIWVGDKKELAHRASYQMHKGQIPAGLWVCHSCDVGLCVNPDHLWLGTHADNIQDMVNKGRGRGPSVGGSYNRGASNPRSKLTVEHVRAIRRSNLSTKQLSQKYSVGLRAISDVLQGKSWKDLPA